MRLSVLLFVCSVFVGPVAFSEGGAHTVVDSCDVTYSNDGFYYVETNGQTMGDGNSELRTILQLRQKLASNGLCLESANAVCKVNYTDGFYYVMKDGRAMSDGYEDVNRALSIRRTLLNNNVCK